MCVEASQKNRCREYRASRQPLANCFSLKRYFLAAGVVVTGLYFFLQEARYTTSIRSVVNEGNASVWPDAKRCLAVSCDGCNLLNFTLHDLLAAWPRNKTRGLIYILAPPEKIESLPVLLKNIEDNFNTPFKYPVLVFVERADATTRLREALTGSGSANENDATVFVCDITSLWKVPSAVLQKHGNNLDRFTNFSIESIRKTSCPSPNHIGYWLACRFHAKIVTEIPFIQEFDYLWRLDVDSVLCRTIPTDLFAFMEAHDYWQGYLVELGYDRCADFLTQHVHQFTRDYNIVPVQGAASIADAPRNYIYNNFEIYKVAFYRSQEYIRYIDFIEHSGGFFYYRWSDAPVRTQASRLFMPKDKMYQFQSGEVYYKHHVLNRC